MLKNTIINRMATVKVAKALGDLNSQVVFVGGAMVSLYIDDPAAEDIRPTKDIDLTFQVTTSSKLEELRLALNQKGFYEDVNSDVICRFTFEDLLVDVMSTHAVGWAPSNRWFKPGFHKANIIRFEDIEVQVLPLPYFLASKMDAFFDRGITDVYSSHDLEDIVYLFNYGTRIVDQILTSDSEVRNYLVQSINKIVEDERIMNALPGYLSFYDADERMEIITDKMKAIGNGLH